MNFHPLTVLVTPSQKQFHSPKKVNHYKNNIRDMEIFYFLPIWKASKLHSPGKFCQRYRITPRLFDPSIYTKSYMMDSLLPCKPTRSLHSASEAVL